MMMIMIAKRCLYIKYFDDDDDDDHVEIFYVCFVFY